MLVLFAGCVKDEALLENSLYDIVARMEYGADTRTSLSGLQEDGLYYPLWSEGDEIAMYVDGDVSPSKFELVSGTGKTEATFAGTREGASCYAVYPFSAAGKQQDGTISLVLPGTQQYVAGSFGPDSYPMIASGNKNEGLDFKNLCAVMKISITGDATIRSITLTARDTSAKLSGPATVSMENGTEPVLVMEKNGSNSVVLECKGTELDKDIPVDFHFVVPAQTYKGGFELSVDVYTDVVKKGIDSDLKFNRSKMRHLKGMELSGIDVDEHQLQLAKERTALEGLYEALDGNNWWSKENWCSDKPISEWVGISVNREGYVIGINLRANNLSGNIPASIGNFKYLEYLNLQANDNIKSVPEEIAKLEALEELWFDLNKCGLPDALYGLKNIKRLILETADLERVFEFPQLELLYINKATGRIPSSIGNRTSLKDLKIYGAVDGSIPSSIGNCANLQYLTISDSNLSGSIPAELGNCAKLEQLILVNNRLGGSIPASLGNCKGLNDIQLHGNMLQGGIPESIEALPLRYLTLYDNNLTGTVPDGIVSNEFLWKNCWAYILNGNDFKIDNLVMQAPSFDVSDISGNRIAAKELYASNKYTLLCQFSAYFSAYQDFTQLKKIYADFSKYGFDVLMYTARKGLWIDARDDIANYLKANAIEWPAVYWDENNEFADCSQDWSMAGYWPYHIFPAYTLVDSTGRIVYFKYDAHKDQSLASLSEFLLKNIEGVELDYYISTDYSQDGTKVELQKASEGNGINIVLLGDGYSDRQIADGSYKADMEFAYRNLFTEEPYKSFKSLFNVSYVNVVSATEGYEHGKTALEGGFGDGTLVFGNDNTCFNYALKVIDPKQMNETLIIVVMNSDKYAGTCYMYYPNNSDTDYGTGPAVAYFPKGKEEAVFAQLLHHEACGHGFSKLADEYAYEHMGAIPTQEVEQTRNQQSLYGWWKNVDFTNDPAQVRWKQFLEDSRYANDGLGVFEGGLTYWSGVWRPTENSIMRHNTGGFNAPSREAVYYRIHKLAYGKDWQYDYEKFVAWDAVNRSSGAAASRTYVLPLKPQPALHPPVVVERHWDSAATNQ